MVQKLNGNREFGYFYSSLGTISAWGVHIHKNIVMTNKC